MPATVRSAAIVGIDAVPVDVEVEELRGLPSVTIVGLPDAAVREARERITAALQNTGFVPPRYRTIVNLAPAHVRKEGPQYDLPIALGYLAVSGQLVANLDGVCVVGVLGLDGSLRSTPGTFAVAEHARRSGSSALVVPAESAVEAAATGVQTFAPRTLRELVDHLEGRRRLTPVSAPSAPAEDSSEVTDFSTVAGQELAKRALEIAAAGGHNVLLHGPPGAGKSLLARALVGILPPLSDEEAFAVTRIWSIRGILPAGATLLRARPFRAPHHSISAVALIGGGPHPLPGEVTLAHTGVLFLDEFAEFPRHVLEQLRQPLEDGIVHVSRAAGTATFPARFTLIAAMNPCPCGFYSDPDHPCRCPPGAILRYRERLSGPLLDRIDLNVHVPAVGPEVLLRPGRHGENSEAVRVRVMGARSRQAERQGGAQRTNATLPLDDLRQHAALGRAETDLLARAAGHLHLSARAVHRTIRVARTIADLSDAETIELNHLAETLQYRAPFTDG